MSQIKQGTKKATISHEVKNSITISPSKVFYILGIIIGILFFINVTTIVFKYSVELQIENYVNILMSFFLF
jgi:hypothetical protein